MRAAAPRSFIGSEIDCMCPRNRRSAGSAGSDRGEIGLIDTPLRPILVGNNERMPDYAVTITRAASLIRRGHG